MTEQELLDRIKAAKANTNRFDCFEQWLEALTEFVLGLARVEVEALEALIEAFPEAAEWAGEGQVEAKSFAKDEVEESEPEVEPEPEHADGEGDPYQPEPEVEAEPEPEEQGGGAEPTVEPSFEDEG